MERIGSGAYATVYRAIQLDLDRPVAIKVLEITPGVDHRRLQDQFDAERRTLGRLTGVPGVVDVHLTTFAIDGRPAIVMELMATSLSARLRREGSLCGDEVIRTGIRLAHALALAHDRGVFHRDIKPSNVLQAPDGRVELADFGVAALHLQAGGLADTGAGSPEHCSPERLTAEGGPIELGPSDVYSLASTLYQLVTGQPPYGNRHGEGGIDGLILRVTRSPMPLVTRPDINPALMVALSVGLAKNPLDRYGSSAEFSTALAALTDGAVHEVGPSSTFLSGLSSPAVASAPVHLEPPSDLSTVSASVGTDMQNRSTRGHNPMVGSEFDDETTIQPVAIPLTGPIADTLRRERAQHARSQSIRRRAIVVVVMVIVIAALAAGLWVRLRHTSSSANGPTPRSELTARSLGLARPY